MSSRGGGFGGQPNMQQLMKQAQKMQQQLAEAQAELAEAEHSVFDLRHGDDFRAFGR